MLASGICLLSMPNGKISDPSTAKNKAKNKFIILQVYMAKKHINIELFVENISFDRAEFFWVQRQS
jgi:hypothetical protein